MRTIATIAAILVASTALATGPGQGGSPSARSDAEMRAHLYAQQRVRNEARAAAKANADSASKATARSGDVSSINANSNTATGGHSYAAGGHAIAGQSQTQGSVTGRQNARTGDVSSTVVVEGDDNDYPASSAIAPNVVIGDSNECYWTFAIAGAAQGTGGGGSAGAGLFPTRLPTCMMFMLADRYAAGYGDNPDALRLLREIEASLE